MTEEQGAGKRRPDIGVVQVRFWEPFCDMCDWVGDNRGTRAAALSTLAAHTASLTHQSEYDAQNESGKDDAP